MRSEMGRHGQPAYDYDFLFVDNAPGEEADKDTLVLASDIPATTIVVASCQFETMGGTEYAIAVTIDNQLAQLEPDIRQLRSAEPISGQGSVGFAVWLDGITGTYHYSVEVQGGGNALKRISLLARTTVSR